MNENPKFFFTVGSLIEILKEFPPELPVLVSGYESGFDNFYQPRIVELTYKPENMYFDGEFQEPEKNDKTVFKAVLLERVMRDD